MAQPIPTQNVDLKYYGVIDNGISASSSPFAPWTLLHHSLFSLLHDHRSFAGRHWLGKGDPRFLSHLHHTPVCMTVHGSWTFCDSVLPYIGRYVASTVASTQSRCGETPC